jgi:hypothetical protein
VIVMTLSSTLSRNFPTLKYVFAPFRWFFRSRRRVLTTAAVMLAMIAAPPLWWCVQLLGLPDIGEPFDVKASRSFAIPDDRNAFVLYRRAAASLKPIDPSTGKIRRFDDRWSAAEPAFRHWLEQNREALDLYRQGSDRPDAFDETAIGGPAIQVLQPDLSLLYCLALLEASRLEERGDMTGAWIWYRAALRATYHHGRYARVWQRSIAWNWPAAIRGRLVSWASDTRTTPPALRQALDDLIACEELLPSDAYTIKSEYPALERMLEGPENPGQGEPFSRLNAFFKSWEIRPTPEQIYHLSVAWRSWRRESERSRRVLRLAVANWVAYGELPRGRRPKPSPDVPYPFYELGPEAPAGARAVSPAELGRWLASTIDADALFRSWGFLPGLRRVQIQEQASYRALVVLVASELYRRERGTDPPSEEALVGSYLERLPEDGAGEATGAAGSAGSGSP